MAFCEVAVTGVLEPGCVIGERFTIEALAGSGGMGAVYRARDRVDGGVVALKVCRTGSSAQVTRFSREIRALAALRHPGIVGYVADGHAPDGQPFLAMEWLAGEDLGRRLRREPLTPAESVQVGVRIATALAAAHAAGIVHRDLKPSNVFLRGGKVEEATLLDFGIARLGTGTLGWTLTATGALVGTPDYMSPEQARGDREVGPTADLFSLGSLLFECLTGHPPFAADRMMAVLAKIVFEEAPRLVSAWPQAPAGLDALIARLLAKEPEGRPGSADEVARELLAMQALAFGPGPSIAAAPALQGPEQQILSVVLVAPPGLTGEQLKGLRRTVAQSEGRVEPLADGSVALVFGQTMRAAATDRASQAARCALLVKEQVPSARVAVATGRGVLHGGTPGGGALEQAAELLDATPEPGGSEDPPIWIDVATAGLIEPSFVVRAAGARRRQLITEQVSLDPTRPLLGKPTPCVGREVDLAALTGALASAVEEPAARVVVVRAPPGMGKSRLRHEFMRRAIAQHRELMVVLGRCDPMGAGSSYGLLGQVIRELCGVLDSTVPDELRRRLKAWGEERLPAQEGPRVVAFLGELCGAPFADEQAPGLRSARQDAGLMAEQVTIAFTTFLKVECADRPLLLVLEDLHWGDRATVRVVAAALAELKELPFMVLALARPEIDELFPRLWEEHGPTNVWLRALGRRPCEALCRGVLGAAVADSVVARIVEQSGGNALFLEELIRAVAEGKGEVLPETVLAMLHARLMRLAPDARRVLRAASVFGETFWIGGVRALLGQPGHDGVDGWLEALIEAELVVAARDGGLPGEVGYRFRHALMRDAAYSMLAAEDRVAGHRAAGRFLEAAGECDPMILGRHFALGQERTRAGECYAQAAQQAHYRGDAAAVIARAELAIAQHLPEHLRAGLLALIAEELGWQLDFKAGGAIAAEVLRMSPVGSVPWATAVAPRIFDVLLHGHREAAQALHDQVCAVTPERAALAKLSFGMFAGAFWFYLDGDPRGAARLLARQRELVEGLADDEPLAYAWFCAARAHHDAIGEAGPATALAHGERCRETFHRIHHTRGESLAQIMIGRSLWMLGRAAEAERVLMAGVVLEVEHGPVEGDRLACMVDLLVAQGRVAEAVTFADAALARMGRHGEVVTIFEGMTRMARATALAALGQAEQAEAEAREACDRMRSATGVRLGMLADLARILLRRGRSAEALALASECAEAHAHRGFHGPKHAGLHLTRAEALWSLGDRAGARAAIAAAQAVLRERAGRIADAGLRESFLNGLADHARIAELAAG